MATNVVHEEKKLHKQIWIFRHKIMSRLSLAGFKCGVLSLCEYDSNVYDYCYFWMVNIPVTSIILLCHQLPVARRSWHVI